jgi:hypothetical protein
MTPTLDNPLFGLKDFGELTLPELMTLHTHIYESASIYPPERLQSWFQCEAFHSAAIDIGPNHTSSRYIADTPRRIKYQEMYNQLFDPNHKYRIKFDVFRKEYSDPDPDFTSILGLYAIFIWVDDVLMDDPSQKYYRWFELHWDTDLDNDTSLYRINEAHLAARKRP